LRALSMFSSFVQVNGRRSSAARPSQKGF
jgi:hypothetical protein